jgi:hypothetical protein
VHNRCHRTLSWFIGSSCHLDSGHRSTLVHKIEIVLSGALVLAVAHLGALNHCFDNRLGNLFRLVHEFKQAL